MSDFLVSFDKRVAGEKMVQLLQSLYSAGAPQGEWHAFPWGTLALLRDAVNHGDNLHVNGSTFHAWFGDVVLENPGEELRVLHDYLHSIEKCAEPQQVLRNRVLDKLNGAFIILLADRDGLFLITDPVSFTPVYQVRNSEPAVVGSQPDLVSCIGPRPFDIDVVSVGEFLNAGTPTYPHTVYTDVFQIDSASVFRYRKVQNHWTCQNWKYWLPPAELDEKSVSEEDMVDELAVVLKGAVAARVKHGKVGVLLSGGLDSRLIMSSISPTTECVAITFGDAMNREMRTARRVAAALNREWLPVWRHPEYLYDQLLGSVRFTGCEYDWVHAHAAGCARQIQDLHLGVLLDGSYSNTYLRGRSAYEYERRSRFKGLLPCKYVRKHVDYQDIILPESERAIKPTVVQGMQARREHYVKGRGSSRLSLSEWLNVNPVTQRPALAVWAVERRLFPARLVFADRGILSFAFRCPITLKVRNEVFTKAAIPLLGRGICVPDANDGVRPGSGYVYRLLQRAIRKTEDCFLQCFENCCKYRTVSHSWHDYEKYWRESKELEELRRRCSAKLNRFDGTLFKDGGQLMFSDKGIDCRYGFRLAQLVVWLGVLDKYKDVLAGD
jgi:hypothetical protein